MKSALVLLSGNGSNLPSLIAGARSYQVSAVFSDKSNAEGLRLAKTAGLPTASFPQKYYPSLDEQKSALYAAIEEQQADFVLLAGFMQIIRADFAYRFAGRILNIHPSLLPLYPGLDTYARALADGLRQHGCTVHLVDAGLDTGPVLAQAACEVFAQDTEESLRARVFALEERLYPAVANAFAEGAFALKEGSKENPKEIRVEVRQDARERLVAQGFHIPGE